VENDPAHLDLEFWLSYFDRVHAEGVCLSAGGYVAYYPTDIPLHHRSRWLDETPTGSGDPFGDLVAGCCAKDRVVLARTDPHAVHQNVFDLHPDWIAVDAEGRHRRHWAKPDAWVTCALGPYNFEFMTEVHKEIVTRYPIQGIFSNRWAGHGICYCEHCQRNFGGATGLPLPRSRDLEDVSWRRYRLWREARLLDLARLWDRSIRAVRPEARYIPNSGGGALSDLDMKTLASMTPLLFADRQARSGVTPPWANGKNAKEYRAAFGEKPIGGIFSVGLEAEYRWKDSVQSEPELRIWVADGIANGMRPWFTKFSAQIYDDRWLDVVADLYDWHHRHANYLVGGEPVVQVAVVYSQQTGAFYGGPEAYANVEAPILGVCQALIEARIPFEMVHDRMLDEERLEGFKTLILPNIAALSDNQCEQLREFVHRGGSLVATYETSRYDAWGRPRLNFGLADLFGVDDVGEVEGPIKNAYLNLEHKAETAGFFLNGLRDAKRMIYGGYQVHVRLNREPLAPPVTLVPAYPDLPMEEVYPRRPHTDIPGVFCHETAGGRIVYFPWDLGRIFWEVLNADHGKLLANAVRWATNADPHVSVAGPGFLEVTDWQQADARVVHLVNLTNTMTMRGAYRELHPVGEQHVRVRLPRGREPSRVRLLKSGQTCSFEWDPPIVSLRVPQVVDHEVVVIALT
jgi:hypothetical protein